VNDTFPGFFVRVTESDAWYVLLPEFPNATAAPEAVLASTMLIEVSPV
jgi:hypothetical protein